MNGSHDRFTRAQVHIPGGVNSPVRAFRSVGGTPPFIARGEGSQRMLHAVAELAQHVVEAEADQQPGEGKAPLHPDEAQRDKTVDEKEVHRTLPKTLWT